MKQAIYKVPEGKLLKIFLEEEDGKVANVKITGDFFMHPEERIIALEEGVKGEELQEDVLARKLDGVIKEEGLELFGIDAASIAKTIMMAAS